VRCIPRRDLTAADPAARRAAAPTHVSLVVLPEPAPPPRGPAAGAEPDGQQPDAALHAGLWAFLDGRRILTTRHHVVAPAFVDIRVAANLAPREDAPPAEATGAAARALAAFFDPLTGGPERTGWPFGRAVYASEVAAVLEAVALVDHVEDVQVSAPAEPERARHDGPSVALDTHELVRLQASDLAAYDAHGRPYDRPRGRQGRRRPERRRLPPVPPGP
jgi:hypothetical protein